MTVKDQTIAQESMTFLYEFFEKMSDFKENLWIDFHKFPQIS